MHARPVNSLPACLRRLLRATARSFYLTLQVLPGAVRPQIGLAYLLARTADTIADTEVLPVEHRLRALAEFRDWLLGRRHEPPDFELFRRHQGDTPECELLRRSGEAVALLNRFSSADQAHIRRVLETILSGQELDLRRFATPAAGGDLTLNLPSDRGPLTLPSAPVGERVAAGRVRGWFKGTLRGCVWGGLTPAPIRCLQTEEELDDYTYRVAGCVGEFWTRLCRTHVFPAASLDETWLIAQGVRFGKGLQLVNILRDLPVDLRQGRCYVPEQMLARAGLQPAELLHPEVEPRFRPVYHELLARAEAHLAAGWAYTNALPRRATRIRLACAWPILLGRETLARLRCANVLDPSQRIKVSRAEVRRLLVRTAWRAPFPRAWQRLWPQNGHREVGGMGGGDGE